MVWLGISPFVVVHDLQMVKEVLHSPTSAKNYEKGMFAEIMRPLLGQGLLLSEGTAQDQKSQLWGGARSSSCSVLTLCATGDIWREHHRLVAPAFQPSHYRNALPGGCSRHTRVGTFLEAEKYRLTLVCALRDDRKDGGPPEQVAAVCRLQATPYVNSARDAWACPHHQ
jgi:hypothetical protein